jgi:hypothetical protein
MGVQTSYPSKLICTIMGRKDGDELSPGRLAVAVGARPAGVGAARLGVGGACKSFASVCRYGSVLCVVLLT